MLLIMHQKLISTIDGEVLTENCFSKYSYLRHCFVFFHPFFLFNTQAD